MGVEVALGGSPVRRGRCDDTLDIAGQGGDLRLKRRRAAGSLYRRLELSPRRGGATLREFGACGGYLLDGGLYRAVAGAAVPAGYSRGLRLLSAPAGCGSRQFGQSR
jgi:hypothetical protein